jgi:Pyruvate phosphate dikinase, AMP/ATP-binding domain
MQETLTFILPRSDISARLSLVGGKGASLARMAAAGLSVPPGFYITTAAYRRFVMENELQGAILAAVSSIKADDPATLEEASKQNEHLPRPGHEISGREVVVEPVNAVKPGESDCCCFLRSEYLSCLCFCDRLR